MGQSESNNSEEVKVTLPKRSLNVEFVVGVFSLFAMLAVAYLCVNLGGLDLMPGRSYVVNAVFDNISGLEKGASVEIAGVKIGTVVDIKLADPEAVVSMKIDQEKIRVDDIAAIRTKGIIGDRYVKITRGASDEYVENGGEIIDTESVVDIEDIIGKLVHSFSGDEKSGDEAK